MSSLNANERNEDRDHYLRVLQMTIAGVNRLLAGAQHGDRPKERGRGRLWVLGALVIGIALGGCDKGGNVSVGSVVGEWVLDIDLTRASISPAKEKMLRAELSDEGFDELIAGLDMAMTFNSDGTFKMIMTSKMEQRYEVTFCSWTQTAHLIAMSQCKGNENIVNEDVVVAQLKDNKLFMGNDDGVVFVLKRK